MIITLPITVLGLFLQAQRQSSPAAMKRQRNSGQVHPIVRRNQSLLLCNFLKNSNNPATNNPLAIAGKISRHTFAKYQSLAGCSFKAGMEIKSNKPLVKALRAKGCVAFQVFLIVGHSLKIEYSA